ncbi:MAG: hypothetical protein RIR12_2630 [Bacteroidota bacterium]|jgi:hypothetical protein
MNTYYFDKSNSYIAAKQKNSANLSLPKGSRSVCFIRMQIHVDKAKGDNEF